MAKLKIEEIEKKIKEKNAHWKAKENHISKMEEKEQKKLLGALKEETIASVTLNETEPPASAVGEFDWRTLGNVTPVKDQKSCGSCVSFAAVAVTESMVSIEKKMTVDLSEADSHFCSSHGVNCDGWYTYTGMDQIRVRGVCDEACAPYGTGIAVCNPCSDRDLRAYKVTTVKSLTGLENVKTHISTIGPVIAAFDVYSDFYSYGSGVYKNVTGTYQGGHAICVVGYSDIEQCWICKNSWNINWGDNGYFKIAYGQCNIDAYSKVGAYGVILPGTPTTTSTTTKAGPTTTTTTAGPTTTSSTTKAGPTTTTTTAGPTTTTTLPVNTLTVTPTSVIVSQTAGTTKFTVTSNTAWTAISNATWCTVTPSGTGNGVINATFTTNTGAARTATITVKTTSLTVNVTVQQKKKVGNKLLRFLSNLF